MEGLRPIAGIDYGARLSGTTVMAVHDGLEVRLHPITKGQDADQALIRLLADVRPVIVAIDAPLSLPRAILGRGDDFHFRRADRMCQAMSPMFLGGLTARAMALRHRFRQEAMTWLETYPTWLARMRFGLDRKQHDLLVEKVQALWPEIPVPRPRDGHQMDALLALMAAEHYRRHVSWHYGDPSEGAIVI